MKKVEFEEYATKETIPVSNGPIRNESKRESVLNLEIDYKLKGHSEHYSTTHDFVESVGKILKAIGYNPGEGTAFRYKNLETDYTLHLNFKERFVAFPTIDFYPYRKGSDMVAQLFLYDKSILQFNKTPTGIVLLSNEDNEDFEGRKFNVEKIKQPQQVFLRNMLKDKKVKQISKKEIIRKLDSISSG